MRIVGWVVLACVACGHAESPSPPTAPIQRAPASANAAAVLRAGRFDDAIAQASTALQAESRDSQAAAVRAIAAYARAGTRLADELRAVSDQADTLHSFDHQRGRAAWIRALQDLEAIDRDLAVVAKDPDFSLEVCPACWEYDWNHSGQVDDRDRRLFQLEYDGKGGELAETDPRRKPTFRLDVGDADWARAMLSFQRAAIEVILAYRWSELDKLFGHDRDMVMTIHLVDPDRVKHAHKLILEGLGFADRCRQAYLAETDDDREWVPSPRQKNHAVPLEVDDLLYQRWADTIADVRRLLDSEEGLSIDQTLLLIDDDLGKYGTGAYLDIGRMLRQPKDIVLDLRKEPKTGDDLGRILQGVFGNGYSTTPMRASPLVGRLRHMKDELEHEDDRLERKLRYLFWLN